MSEPSGSATTQLLTAEEAPAAGRLLAAGLLVVIPTETVYGLAANALDTGAVRAIFGAKGRPSDNPLIVHFASSRDARDAAPKARQLALDALEAFAPGPLTVVVPRPAWVPPEVSAGLPTVALRVPAHPVARAVIGAAGVPIAAPSANRSGRPSPTDIESARHEMDGRVAAIIDGGPCLIGIESTVIAVRGDRDREIVVLRPGAVTAAELERVLGCRVVLPTMSENLASPGTRHRHYQPTMPLIVAPAALIATVRARWRGDEASEVAIVGTRAAGGGCDDFECYTRRLYAELFAAERRGARVVLCQAVDAARAPGLNDRLSRAATAVCADDASPDALVDLIDTLVAR